MIIVPRKRPPVPKKDLVSIPSTSKISLTSISFPAPTLLLAFPKNMDKTLNVTSGIVVSIPAALFAIPRDSLIVVTRDPTPVIGALKHAAANIIATINTTFLLPFKIASSIISKFISGYN